MVTEPAKWERPSRPTNGHERGALAVTAMTLGTVSVVALFIAYVGWLADILLGPLAMLTSIAAVAHAIRRGANRLFALGALLAATPAFVWAAYAILTRLQTSQPSTPIR
jgi:hypothetical protein